MNKTKKVIFEAAIKAFSKKGYHKATMDEIAEIAGVAKGTLYYHFKSKEDIFKFIIDEGIKVVKEELNDKTKHLEDPSEKLRKVCEVQLKLVITYLPFFKTLLSQMWGDEDRQEQCREVLAKYFKLLEGYLVEAADEEVVKKNNIEIIAFNFFGVMASTVVYSITHTNIETDEVLDTLVEFLMRGIGKK